MTSPTDHHTRSGPYQAGGVTHAPAPPQPTTAPRPLADEVDYLRKLLLVNIFLTTPALFFAVVAALSSGYTAYVVWRALEALGEFADRMRDIGI